MQVRNERRWREKGVVYQQQAATNTEDHRDTVSPEEGASSLDIPLPSHSTTTTTAAINFFSSVRSLFFFLWLTSSLTNSTPSLRPPTHLAFPSQACLEHNLRLGVSIYPSSASSGVAIVSSSDSRRCFSGTYRGEVSELAETSPTSSH
jgi:hypothetical protein